MGQNIKNERSNKGETLADLEAMFASKNKGKAKKFKEWHRTIVLILLFLLAIGIYIWMQSSYQSNFIDTL